MKQYKRLIAAVLSVVLFAGTSMTTYAFSITKAEAKKEMTSIYLEVYDTTTQAVKLDYKDIIFDDQQRMVDRYVAFCSVGGKTLGMTKSTSLNPKLYEFLADKSKSNIHYEEWMINAFNVYRGVEPYDFEGAEAAKKAEQIANMKAKVDTKAVAGDVVKYTNKERNRRGLNELRTDDALMAAAQIRAEECAQMNSIRMNGQPHTRPDGSSWDTVLVIQDQTTYLENTIGGPLHSSSGQSFVNDWMNSPGHKANILNGDIEAIGVGCAVSDKGRVFSVQIFST